MSELYAIEKSTLDNIGNAIRGKKGTTEPIPVANLADEISSISGGGSQANKLAELISGNVTALTEEDLKGLVSVASDSLYRRYTLKSISFPKTVAVIDSGGINQCTSLQNLSMYHGMWSIGDYGIGSCPNLKTLTIFDQEIDPSTKNTDPIYLQSSSFQGTFDGRSDFAIYVPANKLEAYKSATNWSVFADNIFAIEE